ncbi:MAG: hypothetical protein AB7H93_15940 [Vicinamibacterales bacterium]
MPTNADPLVQRLRQVEADLLAIPGVTGCGLGMAADGSGPRLQVFVHDRRALAGVTRDAARVFGATPFDVVVMSPPSADDRRPQAPDRSREDP